MEVIEVFPCPWIKLLDDSWIIYNPILPLVSQPIVFVNEEENDMKY
jgi:hypothetical protein